MLCIVSLPPVVAADLQGMDCMDLGVQFKTRDKSHKSLFSTISLGRDKFLYDVVSGF